MLVATCNLGFYISGISEKSKQSTGLFVCFHSYTRQFPNLTLSNPIEPPKTKTNTNTNINIHILT